MKNSFKLFSLVSMMVLSLSLTGCENDDSVIQNKTITDVAASNPNFSTLVLALQRAGLDDDLANPSASFTVFAPTNAAFAALLTELGVATLNDIPVETLTKVLLYHVKSEKSTASQITTGYYSTLASGPSNGSHLSMYIDMTSVKINDRASITQTDVMADNGVIHVIDKVLLPPTVVGLAQQNSMFSTLVLAVIKADLATTLSGTGPYTVFAPTNEAFSALFTTLGVSGIDALSKQALTPILLAHVVSGNVLSGNLTSGTVPSLNTASPLNIAVSGGGVTINGSINVLKADVQGSNGVVHVINKVIVP